MAVQLPLTIPVEISERRNYTVKINVCDVSAAIDTTKLQVKAYPTFSGSQVIRGFLNSSATYPDFVNVTSYLDVRQYRVAGTREFVPAYKYYRIPEGVYPVLSYTPYVSLMPAPISLAWSYASKTLSVTLPFAASFPSPYQYPADWAQYGEFSASYVPQNYVWYANIVNSDGTYTQLVELSPITITLAALEEEKRRQETTLSICSTQVV